MAHTLATTAPSRTDSPPGRPSDHPWSWTLGTLFGIDLRVHVTFVILLAWIAFVHLAQGHGVVVAATGLGLVLSVFAIVVLHELGHALVARRYGIATRDITLLPFGGVASLERMPDEPRQEILVALAGPAVNVLLALVLAVALWASGAEFGVDTTHVGGGSLLAQLMWINLSLAAFNLLPAFPMDGGRVLRAALATRMDEVTATRIAATVGQVLAVVLGIVGLVTHPMLLVIAVFVWMSARQESASAQIHGVLAGLTAGAAMITRFVRLGPDDPLARAVDHVGAGLQHDFPIVQDGTPIGMLTREDLVRGLAERGPTARISTIMRQDVVTASAEESVEAACARATEGELGTVVVTDHGRAVGIVTLDHVAALAALRAALRARA